MFKSDINILVLRSSAVVQLLLGILLWLSPGISSLSSSLTLQPIVLFLLGSFAFSLGIGFFIASYDPYQHWLTVLVGLVSKLFTVALFIGPAAEGEIPLTMTLVLLVTEVLWIVPFFFILQNAFLVHTQEESSPKKFSDLISHIRTNEGKTLLEHSQEKRVLLVFIRQFGCIFCRENMRELSRLKLMNDQKGLKLIFVHMSDPAFADDFFAKYFQEKITHVSDPCRVLYKAMGLKRGTFFQLFGPATWLRGGLVMLSKGIIQGKTEGDPLQLGGIFILHQGQITFEQKTARASSLFEISSLPES